MNAQDRKRLKQILHSADRLTALRSQILGAAPTPADRPSIASTAGVNLLYPYSFGSTVMYAPPAKSRFLLRLEIRAGTPQRQLPFWVYNLARWGVDAFAVTFSMWCRAFGMGAARCK